MTGDRPNAERIHGGDDGSKVTVAKLHVVRIVARRAPLVVTSDVTS